MVTITLGSIFAGSTVFINQSYPDIDKVVLLLFYIVLLFVEVRLFFMWVLRLSLIFLVRLFYSSESVHQPMEDSYGNFLCFVVLPSFFILFYFGHIVLGSLFIHYPGLGAKLLMRVSTDSATSSDSQEINHSGVLWFLGFIYNITITVLWYAYRYDPQGTVNQGWTGVFG